MTRTHVFPTQIAGVMFFMDVLTRAANRGWADGSVVPAFRKSLGLEGDEKAVMSPTAAEATNTADADDDMVITQWYALSVAPIVAFYNSVVENGDDSMQCNFSVNIAPGSSPHEPLIGTAEWRGTKTKGRFIKVTFGEDGSAVMTYDLGRRDGHEIERSRFLGLPLPGDRVVERGVVEAREELIRQFEAANQPPTWRMTDTPTARRLVCRAYVAWQNWHIEQFLTEGGFNSPKANDLLDEAQRLQALLDQEREQGDLRQSLQQPSQSTTKTIWQRLRCGLFGR